MGWGCNKHEWDEGSEDWQAFYGMLAEEENGKGFPEWGRDGAICPKCFVALRESWGDQREQIERLRTLAQERWETGDRNRLAGDEARAALAAVLEMSPDEVVRHLKEPAADLARYKALAEERLEEVERMDVLHTNAIHRVQDERNAAFLLAEEQKNVARATLTAIEEETK